jgi:hypothetical protein
VKKLANIKRDEGSIHRIMTTLGRKQLPVRKMPQRYTQVNTIKRIHYAKIYNDFYVQRLVHLIVYTGKSDSFRGRAECGESRMLWLGGELLVSLHFLIFIITKE